MTSKSLIINKIGSILLITVLFFLSPITAIALIIYYLALVNLWNSYQQIIYSIIIAIVCCYYSLFKLKIFLIIHLFSNNLVYLTGFNLWRYIVASVIDFKINTIDNGVLGITGIIMIVLELIKLLAPKSITKTINIAKEEDDIYLGINSNNIPVFINDYELNQHALVIGTTGSGKTTTLMNIVDSVCKRNLPLIYLDGKGSINLSLNIMKICNKYGRTLKVFTIDPNDQTPNIASYNPLAFGNFTEWKNKIITLIGDPENRGQEHYSIQEQSYINLVCEILNKSNHYIDLEILIAYLKDPLQLQKIANKVNLELVNRLLSDQNDKVIMNDIIKILETFYYSHYGHLFSTSKKDGNEIINLQTAIKNNEVILFLFDAASFKRDTNLLGKLVINDINSAWANFGRQGLTIPGYCIFDEFASYASANMANVLAMQRSNGLHAIVGTQSINAISKESITIKRIAVELIANCNTYFIHKLNDPEDIDLLTKTIGTKKNYQITNTYDKDDNHRITTSIQDKLILDGQSIRELTSGYGFLCRTVNTHTIVKIKYNMIK